jgi:NtrC-family two-component system sensor histidine kinase KinB
MPGSDMVATTLRGTQAVSDVPLRPTGELQRLRAEHHSLLEAHEHLLEMQRMQQELVTMLVHDLKAPLAIILTGLELLSLELDQQMDADQRSIFDSAGRAGQEMLQLITNLLEVQRLQSGRMPVCPEPFDMSRVLQEAASQARLPARKKGVDLHLRVQQGLACAWADVHLSTRIVTNLLDNALRFTPSGGEVYVAGQTQEGRLIVSVTDGGPGIPAEQQKRIFDRYHQAKLGQRKGSTGVGLGLAFCKLAVEAQRGRIWVESTQGAGACFSFSLPEWRGPVPESTLLPLAIDY